MMKISNSPFAITGDSPDYSKYNTSQSPIEPSNHHSLLVNIDYRNEYERLQTFTSAWPHQHLDPKLLAQTGFYYLGTSDNVKCFFCRVEIGRWELSDRAVSEHQRWSSNCPLLKRRHTENIPINADALDQVLPPRTIDVCGAGVQIRRNTVSEGSFDVPPTALHMLSAMSPVTMSQPPVGYVSEVSSCRVSKYPEYAIESARLRSFEAWPKTMKQKPKELSDAGLFYTTKGDRVQCFSCGGGIRDWEEEDVPWEQHAKWFGHCEYVQLIKGQEYVDRVCLKATTENVPSNGYASEAPEPEKFPTMSERQECDTKLCKICYTSEYNTTFTPCGHVAACAKCALSVSQCPICRKPVERVIRLFFS